MGETSAQISSIGCWRPSAHRNSLRNAWNRFCLQAPTKYLKNSFMIFWTSVSPSWSPTSPMPRWPLFWTASHWWRCLSQGRCHGPNWTSCVFWGRCAGTIWVTFMFFTYSISWNCRSSPRSIIFRKCTRYWPSWLSDIPYFIHIPTPCSKLNRFFVLNCHKKQILLTTFQKQN